MRDKPKECDEFELNDRHQCVFPMCDCGEPPLHAVTRKTSWVDTLPKSTDKCEAIIHSASTLNEDGIETEYYNRERDGHKELSELLPTLPDDLTQLIEPTQEQEIERLQEALLFQNKKIVQLTEENKRLKEQLFGNINQPNY